MIAPLSSSLRASASSAFTSIASHSKERLSARNGPPLPTCRPPPETRVDSHLPGSPASSREAPPLHPLQGWGAPSSRDCLTSLPEGPEPAESSSPRRSPECPVESREQLLTVVLFSSLYLAGPARRLFPLVPQTMRRPYLRSLRKERGWRRCEHTILVCAPPPVAAGRAHPPRLAEETP